MAPKICQQNPLLCSFSLQFLLSSEQLFYKKLFGIRFSNKHCYFSLGCRLNKMASKTLDKVYLINDLIIQNRSFHSFFNFSHGPVRENLSTPMERLEHLKISEIIAKFESDTSYYNERRYSSAKLRKFTKLFGGGASLCPTKY